MRIRITPRDEALHVVFEDGRQADYHWFWLRHECSRERHPLTNERTLAMSDVPLDVRPADVALDPTFGVVSIRWQGEPSERPASQYTLGWLREHAYALDREEPAAPPKLAHYRAVPAAGKTLPADLWARLVRDGAVVVSAPSAVDAATPEYTERVIAEAEAAGLTAVETHFGRIEDLRTDNTTNANTDQLGYTDAAIALHTDQAFLTAPPRLQMLHAIRPAARGGESLLADGAAAAKWLEASDAVAYEVLTRTPVRFHRKQRAFERIYEGPILDRRADGSIRVRSSYFTMAPHRIPYARMEPFYRAYQKLERHLEATQLRFKLGPGDLLVYDNYRMLHGRAAFEGARWVRGVYFDPAETP